MRRVRNLLSVLVIAATLALVSGAPPLADTARAQPSLIRVNNDTSLGDAIRQANADPDPNTIEFDPDESPSEDFDRLAPLTGSVEIRGNGASLSQGLTFEPAPPPKINDVTTWPRG